MGWDVDGHAGGTNFIIIIVDTIFISHKTVGFYCDNSLIKNQNQDWKQSVTGEKKHISKRTKYGTTRKLKYNN